MPTLTTGAGAIGASTGAPKGGGVPRARAGASAWGASGDGAGRGASSARPQLEQYLVPSGPGVPHATQLVVGTATLVSSDFQCFAEGAEGRPDGGASSVLSKPELAVGSSRVVAFDGAAAVGALIPTGGVGGTTRRPMRAPQSWQNTSVSGLSRPQTPQSTCGRWDTSRTRRVKLAMAGTARAGSRSFGAIAPETRPAQIGSRPSRANSSAKKCASPAVRRVSPESTKAVRNAGR